MLCNCLQSIFPSRTFKGCLIFFLTFWISWSQNIYETRQTEIHLNISSLEGRQLQTFNPISFYGGIKQISVDSSGLQFQTFSQEVPSIACLESIQILFVVWSGFSNISTIFLQIYGQLYNLSSGTTIFQKLFLVSSDSSIIFQGYHQNYPQVIAMNSIQGFAVTWHGFSNMTSGLETFVAFYKYTNGALESIGGGPTMIGVGTLSDVGGGGSIVTQDYQSDPQGAFLENLEIYVVTWTGYATISIYPQIFSRAYQYQISNGEFTPLGQIELVSNWIAACAFPSSSQYLPKIAALNSENAIIINWEASQSNTETFKIFAQVYAFNSTTYFQNVSAAIQVSSVLFNTYNQMGPSVACIDSYNLFAVVWFGEADTAPTLQIWGASYNFTTNTGITLISPPTRVSSDDNIDFISFDQSNPSVIGLEKSHQLIITWRGKSNISVAQPQIYQKNVILNSSTSFVGNPVLVSNGTQNSILFINFEQNNPSLCSVDSNRTYALVWCGEANTSANFAIFGNIMTNFECATNLECQNISKWQPICGENHECQACTNNIECVNLGLSKLCQSQQCIQCVNNTECMDGPLQFCNNSSGLCIGCTSNLECQLSYPNLPYCSLGTCVSQVEAPINDTNSESAVSSTIQTTATITQTTSNTLVILAVISLALGNAGAGIITYLRIMLYMLFFNVNYPEIVELFFWSFRGCKLPFFVPNFLDIDGFINVEPYGIESPPKFYNHEFNGLFLLNSAPSLFSLVVLHLIGRIAQLFDKTKFESLMISDFVENLKLNATKPGFIVQWLELQMQLILASSLQMILPIFDLGSVQYISYFSAGVTLFFGIYFMYCFFKYLGSSRNSNEKSRITEILDDFDINESEFKWFFPFVSSTRNFCHCVILVVCYDVPLLQIGGCLMLGICYTFIVIKSLPWKSRFTNFKVIVEETSLVGIYLLIFVLGYYQNNGQSDESFEYQLGIAIIIMGIIIFTIQVINFIGNIISAWKQTQRKWLISKKKVVTRRFRRPVRGQERTNSILLKRVNISEQSDQHIKV